MYIKMTKFKLAYMTTFALLMAGCNTFPIRQDAQPQASEAAQPLCIQAIAKQRETCSEQSIYQVSAGLPSLDPVQMYILEINDQGLLANPNTAQAALKYIRQEMLTNNKPLVSLFVHGWNNNAQANNEDLIHFEQAVMALNGSQQELEKSKVVGIYVSWRGKTMPAGLSHAFTFWSRKAISEEVGRGQLANFIFELETAVKPVPKTTDPENGKLILSGHSFGASALYNAVGQELLSRFYSSVHAQKTDATREIRGVGDIVILLNPAIQALRFNGLRETVYEKATQAPTQNIFANNKAPIFMMVATEDDLPVETAFPIGRTISHFLSHNARNDMQVYQGIKGEKLLTSIKQAERNSIGFYAPYYSHFLLLADHIQAEPESNLYRVVNASQQVLGLPKKILNEPMVVLNTPQALLNASKGVLETPKTIVEELSYHASENMPQQSLTIGDCLSEDVKKEFKQGRRHIDWLAESLASNNSSESFSTVKATEFSDGKIDLLKLKITNHPGSLNQSIINQWSLLQAYAPDQVLSWSRNPYWFVKAKSNVMQGHNGIWNKNVACLLLSVMATEPVTLQFMEDQQLAQAQPPKPSEQLEQHTVPSNEIGLDHQDVIPASSVTDPSESTMTTSATTLAPMP